jgi:hypothetical protein
MTTDMQDTLSNLQDELLQWILNNPDNDQPHDYIFELADGGVPVYNHDLLAWALEDMDFALSEPEIGPAFDGTPTPINIIAANIFEYLQGELWAYFENNKDMRRCDICEETFDESDLTECPNCEQKFCDSCYTDCWTTDDAETCDLCIPTVDRE